MKKGTVIAVGVLVAIIVVGQCGQEKALGEAKAKEAATLAAMTPAERHTSDSLKAHAERMATLKARGASAIRMAKSAAQARLRDPESARFGETWAGGDSMRVGCGEVNSKNGFGGYSGEQRFAGMAGTVVFADDLKTLTGAQRKLARTLLAACDTAVTITSRR